LNNLTPRDLHSGGLGAFMQGAALLNGLEI